MIRLVRVFFCLMACSVVAGCDIGFTDAVWVQKRTFLLVSTDFNKCVGDGIKMVPGVSVNPGESMPDTISLNVSPPKDVLYFGASVQKKGPHEGEVDFSGRWSNRAGQDRAATKPIFDAVANAIEESCKS
jgi:hypothetical protein